MSIGFSDGSTAQDWPSFYATGSNKTDPAPEEGTTPSINSPMPTSDPNDLKHLNERKTPEEQDMQQENNDDDMMRMNSLDLTQVAMNTDNFRPSTNVEDMRNEPVLDKVLQQLKDQAGRLIEDPTKFILHGQDGWRGGYNAMDRVMPVANDNRNLQIPDDPYIQSQIDQSWNKMVKEGNRPPLKIVPKE